VNFPRYEKYVVLFPTPAEEAKEDINAKRAELRLRIKARELSAGNVRAQAAQPPASVLSSLLSEEKSGRYWFSVVGLEELLDVETFRGVVARVQETTELLVRGGCCVLVGSCSEARRP